MTPAVEIAWSKRRILEVYINIAEFDQGIFGIEEASQQLFGLPASQLSLSEASLLAAVLPNPKQRSVKNLAFLFKDVRWQFLMGLPQF